MSGTAIGGQIELAKQVIKTGGDPKKVPQEDQIETLRRKNTGILEIQETKKNGKKTHALVYHKPKKEPEAKGSKKDKHPKDSSKKASESSRRSKDQDGAGRSSDGHVPKNETLQLGYPEKKMLTERNDDESKDREPPRTLHANISVESYHTQSEAREVSASKARSTRQRSESGAPNSKQSSGKVPIEEDDRSVISGSTSKTKRSSRTEQDDESVISGSTSKTKRSSRTEQDDESVISGSTSKTERPSRKPKPEQDDESVISGSTSRTRKSEQSNTNAPIEQDARSKISGSRSGARTHSSRAPTEYSEGKPPKPDRSRENDSRGSKRDDSPSGKTDRSDRTARQSNLGGTHGGSKHHRSDNASVIEDRGANAKEIDKVKRFSEGLRTLSHGPAGEDYEASRAASIPDVASSVVTNPMTMGKNTDEIPNSYRNLVRRHREGEASDQRPRSSRTGTEVEHKSRTSTSGASRDDASHTTYYDNRDRSPPRSEKSSSTHKTDSVYHSVRGSSRDRASGASKGSDRRKTGEK